MSRNHLPKQLIPFVHGRSLLQIAFERLEGLVPATRRYVCAGSAHAQVIRDGLPGLVGECFLGEPTGRDTLNAVGFSAAAIAKTDPEAVIAVFTADHIIEPVDRFQQIVAQGFALVEKSPDTLVTFGIAPTAAATGYGYLELGESIDPTARQVKRFKEKPDAATAQNYFVAGPQSYLWNSGMFVWKARTLLDCIRRYEPANYDGIMRIAEAWGTPRAQAVIGEIYPTLKKISVDFAVMEPASRDSAVRVAAVPMPLSWLDVGSWPMFAQTCPHDEQNNAVAADRALLYKTSNTLVASNDKNHVIAVAGCDNLIVIHTPQATLVCSAEQAESVKELHRLAGERFGKDVL